MSELGALLRKAREERSYSLEDVQDLTKIRKRYLEAIETGDYKVLPGSFYVRAFVKTYAETVGLDAEELLRLYHKELPVPSNSEAVTSEPILKQKNQNRRSAQHSDRWGKAAVTLLMWAFPILIAVVIYIYISQNKEANPSELDPGKITEETATPTPTPSISPTPTIVPTPTPTPSAPPASLALTRTSKGVMYYDVTGEPGTKLEINVTDKCWISVVKGGVKGEKLHYKTVNEPQTLSFDLSDERLYVSIGRADFATVTVGGVPVEDGDKSDTSKFMFTLAKPAGAANIE